MKSRDCRLTYETIMEYANDTLVRVHVPLLKSFNTAIILSFSLHGAYAGDIMKKRQVKRLTTHWYEDLCLTYHAPYNQMNEVRRRRAAVSGHSDRTWLVGRVELPRAGGSGQPPLAVEFDWLGELSRRAPAAAVSRRSQLNVIGSANEPPRAGGGGDVQPLNLYLVWIVCHLVKVKVIRNRRGCRFKRVFRMIC